MQLSRKSLIRFVVAELQVDSERKTSQNTGRITHAKYSVTSKPAFKVQTLLSIRSTQTWGFKASECHKRSNSWRHFWLSNINMFFFQYFQVANKNIKSTFFFVQKQMWMKTMLSCREEPLWLQLTADTANNILHCSLIHLVPNQKSLVYNNFLNESQLVWKKKSCDSQIYAFTSSVIEMFRGETSRGAAEVLISTCWFHAVK